MIKYTTLYLDLDNTLLDFLAAEKEAIASLLKLHKIPFDDEVIKLYSRINQDYWERFERGEIQKQEIFAGRFETFLEAVDCSGNPEKMAKDYFGFLSEGCQLMEGALEILEYLKSKNYILCATTNGVAKTQYKRIEKSGLDKYFDYVFVSETTGRQKPEKEYFDYVLEHSPEKDKSKILIIGDSMSSDILGGINFSVDTCWFNPAKSEAKYKFNYEIKKLSELKSIL